MRGLGPKSDQPVNRHVELDTVCGVVTERTRSVPKSHVNSAGSTRGIPSTLTWNGCWMLEKMKIVSVIRKNATRDRGESHGTVCSCPPPSFQFKKMNRLAFAP